MIRAYHALGRPQLAEVVERRQSPAAAVAVRVPFNLFEKVFDRAAEAPQQAHVFSSKPAFEIRGDEKILKLQISDESRSPCAGKPYTLTVGGRSREGMTGPAGELRETVPGAARTARLVLRLAEPPAARVAVYLVDLTEEGASTPRGARIRLENLGFTLVGEPDPREDPSWVDALREIDEKTRGQLVDFRRVQGLLDWATYDAQKPLDAPTQAKLLELHGY
jgi:hypothetical protein